MNNSNIQRTPDMSPYVKQNTEAGILSLQQHLHEHSSSYYVSANDRETCVFLLKVGIWGTEKLNVTHMMMLCNQLLCINNSSFSA